MITKRSARIVYLLGAALAASSITLICAEALAPEVVDRAVGVIARGDVTTLALATAVLANLVNFWLVRKLLAITYASVSSINALREVIARQPCMARANLPLAQEGPDPSLLPQRSERPA